MIKENNSIRINFTLQEIKPLVIKNIDKAQNDMYEYALSHCKQYDFWHIDLVNFEKKNINKKSTNADKLCFIIYSTI